jgi:hypothetical protein
MISFKHYLEEQKRDTLVYAFGRYNPPTRGHILHFMAVRDYAIKIGARYEIFISKTVDNKKNPVPVADRIEYVKKAAPVLLTLEPATNMFSIVEVLANSPIKRLVYMAGSDYFDEASSEKAMFDRLVSFAREKGIELTVQMSRQREPQEQISGSALRRAAITNDFKTFLAASPIGMGRIAERDVARMFELTKQGLAAVPPKRKTAA